MDRLWIASITSLLLLFCPKALLASEVKNHYFHCTGPGYNYQIIFELDKTQNQLIQKIQEPDAYQQIEVASETQTVLSEFEITDDVINYKKNNSFFSISRSEGTVLRDNQPVPIQCKESAVDIIAAKRAEIENAKTTRTEFWSPTTGYGDTGYVQLGMLATTDEICQVFKHPFFKYTSDDYRALDTMNSDFDWEGIEAASLWINRMFEKKGVQLRRFGLMENVHNAANANLASCLSQKEQTNPGFYDKLTRHFLGNLRYQGIQCHEQEYRIEQDVDDNGNLIERKIPIGSQTCIDFNYNSGNLNGWNTSTFTLMLIWKEAHPVLEKIFDKGENIMVARLEEMERIRLAEEAAEAERQQKAEAERAEWEQYWANYQSRQKTLMEQVYNFATTGYPEGLQYSHWVEIEECVLTDGNQTIDNRELNMTAFRMYGEFIGETWYIISTDMNIRLMTSTRIPIDRLQNAWGLAFQQCPGRNSNF